jgi:hypothetical protein
MAGPGCRANPTGNKLDPNEMIKQLGEGADVKELITPVGGASALVPGSRRAHSCR